MKKVLLLLMLMPAVFASAQTKQQLIDSIIKVNELQDECRWMDCREGEPYYMFTKLKEKISKEELLELTKHKNAALRLFAVRDLILSGKGDAAAFLLEEFKRNERVIDVVADMVGEEPTTNVVYHDYRNKIWIEAIANIDYVHKELQEKAIAQRLASDEKILELDSLVISKNNAYWLLYASAFENRKFSEKYLPRIEELAFKRHNSYAQQHLLTHYPEQYNERIKAYWYYDFPKAKFKTYDDRFYFTNIVEMMLSSGDEALKPIIAAKLKKYKNWQYAGTNFQDLLKEKGIPFKEHR